MAVPKGESLWVGFDFGEPKQVSRVCICPRSDTNEIFEGDIYELYIWNSKWILLERARAGGKSIPFENCPLEGLFLLKNVAGGTENRIFTWEGKQRWW